MKLRIPKLFRPRSPIADAPPADTQADDRQALQAMQDKAVEGGVPVTFMKSEIPEVDSAFGYGHLDGRRRVQPDNFLDFIGHTVEGEQSAGLAAELGDRERALREEAQHLRSRRADLAAKTEELAATRERKEEIERSVRESETSLQQAEAEHVIADKVGSRLYASLYIFAGLVFILGDVVMSRRIVADALELTGHSLFGVMDESWAFALGLAMISVLLKPAYDRLVEEPYWKGNVRPFAVLILSAAILSGVTLYVLGGFRAEAHAVQAELGMITADTSLDPGQQVTAINQLRRELLSSKLGEVAFILSGILFALAGAVSLGIGLRYLRDHWNVRRPARRGVTRFRKEIEQSRHQRHALAEDVVRRAAELEHLRRMLADQPEAVELERAADGLFQERRQILRDAAPIRTARLQSLYRDGYDLGQVLAREAAIQPEPADSGSNTASRGPRRKRPRAYVALRRAIRESALRPPQPS